MQQLPDPADALRFGQGHEQAGLVHGDNSMANCQ
jgi:hypothetical protein